MTIRNTGLAVAGAVVLVLKPLYHGPLEELVYAYAGNFAVSFALYFATVSATSRYRHGHLLAALATLAAAEVFEAADGFGFMANVYDPFDFVANAAGVGVAVVVDLASSRFLGRRRGTGGEVQGDVVT
jgi:hypothetical protein